MKNILIFLLLVNAANTEEFGWLQSDGSLASNTDSQKSIQGFGGWLVVTPDKNWEQKWNSPVESVPFFSAAEEVEIGEELTILPFFANPKLNGEKSFAIYCDISVQRPDGSFSINEKEILCASGVLKIDPKTIFLASTVIKFIGEKGDPFGEWTVELKFTDSLRKVTVPLKTSFSLVKTKTEKSVRPMDDRVADASKLIPEPKSWSFPDVIEFARAITPRNLEGRAFNQFGLAYSSIDLEQLQVATMPAEKLQNYADIVTHAYPDAVFRQMTESCKTIPLEQMNQTSIANIAYVSIHAVESGTRERATNCLLEIQGRLRKKEL